MTNITKIMKLLIPLYPHLAYECLELLNCKDVDYYLKSDKFTRRLSLQYKLMVKQGILLA